MTRCHKHLLAIVWAVLFIAIESNLNAGTVTLLVIYPAIDVAASLYDARSGRTASVLLFLASALSVSRAR
jgi:hypothetical protein